MVYTQSPIHVRQRFPSFSSKMSTPSCCARSGMCSMIARRTRHCESSASSITAGSSDCESRSIPMTSLTASSLEMMFKRTSEKSSLSSWRKIGSKCSIVAAFPRMVDMPMITDASEARTCCDASTTKSLMHGKIFLRTWSTGTSVEN
eukprot:Amastigsp_a179038_389.p4 type:complete len:147 gc:universal Amastigsp_a179038_389:1406-966(-)